VARAELGGRAETSSTHGYAHGDTRGNERRMDARARRPRRSPGVAAARNNATTPGDPGTSGVGGRLVEKTAGATTGVPPPAGAGGATSASRGGVGGSGAADGGVGKGVRAGAEVYVTELVVGLDAASAGDSMESQGSRANTTRHGVRESLLAAPASGDGSRWDDGNGRFAPRMQSPNNGGPRQRWFDDDQSDPTYENTTQYQRQYYTLKRIEGVAQGWPLSRLLSNLPRLPPPDEVTLFHARAHLKV